MVSHRMRDSYYILFISPLIPYNIFFYNFSLHSSSHLFHPSSQCHFFAFSQLTPPSTSLQPPYNSIPYTPPHFTCHLISTLYNTPSTWNKITWSRFLFFTHIFLHHLPFIKSLFSLLSFDIRSSYIFGDNFSRTWE